MKTRNAIRVALVLSGKYNIAGSTLTVSGFDAFGKPMTEKISDVDTEMLEKDVEAIMCGEMPSPIREITSIEISDK